MVLSQNANASRDFSVYAHVFCGTWVDQCLSQLLNYFFGQDKGTLFKKKKTREPTLKLGSLLRYLMKKAHLRRRKRSTNDDAESSKKWAHQSLFTENLAYLPFIEPTYLKIGFIQQAMYSADLIYPSKMRVTC